MTNTALTAKRVHFSIRLNPHLLQHSNSFLSLNILLQSNMPQASTTPALRHFLPCETTNTFASLAVTSGQSNPEQTELRTASTPEPYKNWTLPTLMLSAWELCDYFKHSITFIRTLHRCLRLNYLVCTQILILLFSWGIVMWTIPRTNCLTSMKLEIVTKVSLKALMFISPW